MRLPMPMLAFLAIDKLLDLSAHTYVNWAALKSANDMIKQILVFCMYLVSLCTGIQIHPIDFFGVSAGEVNDSS